MNVELMETTGKGFTKDAFAGGKMCPSCGAKGLNWLEKHPGRTYRLWCCCLMFLGETLS